MATSPKDTSLSSAFKHAFDQPLENMATTFQALGMEGWETFLRDLIEEPENYEAAAGKFIGKQGEDFNWEYFPRAVFEQAGQLAGSLATRVGGAAVGGLAGGPAGAAVGALLGPGLFEALQLAGPIAYERAKNNGREEPNWDDWKGSLRASTFSGALNAVGIRNVGVLNSIGKGALGQAGKRTALAGGSELGTEWAQGYTEQIGGRAGTEAYKRKRGEYFPSLELEHKAAFGEGLLGFGAGTITQAGTEVLGQVAPPTQDGTLYSNPFTRLFGKKKEAEEAPEPTAVPEETPPQIEDQRPADEILMEQLYGELETEAQKTPTLRKYLDPVTLRGSLISGPETEAAKAWDEDVINKAYEGLAQEIEQEFEAQDVPKENRGPILQEVLDTIKTPGGQDQYVTADLVWDEGITPDNMFRTEDIVFGLVKPKIAALSAEVEPAVEETNLFEPDEYTRPMYNAPNFTSASPVSNSGSSIVTSDLPVGHVNRVMSDPSIGLYMGEPNQLGFYPDKIDPKTLGHSVLRKHLLTLKSDGTSRYGVQGVTKPGNPDKLFKSLHLDKNILGFPVPKKGVSAKNKKIALQAISTGVAQRLLDLKTQGRTVEVAELDRIIDDYYSRFQHVHLTDANQAALEEAMEKREETLTSPSTPEAVPMEARLLGKKSVDVMYEELMKSPLFENQEAQVNEFLASYYSPDGYNAIYEDLIEIAGGNANLQQKVDAVNNSFTFDPGVSPRWLTEAQYAEIENKIYPKYRERMENFIDKELPAITPLLAPGNKGEGAWENITRTRHTGTQLDKYSGGSYAEGFPGADPKNPYYFKPKESVVETGINDENWYSFNPRLSKENEASSGRNLDARRTDPRHYDKSGGGHAVLPGTFGWARGILGRFGPGLFGKMIGEWQQDVYRQGQKKGPDEFKYMRFRSLTGEAKLTPSEKVSQRKLDNIDKALENVFGRGGSVYESALFAPFMTLEKDTGIEAEFGDSSEFPLDPDRYPRYIIKDLPARRNGFLRRIPGVGDARRLLGTTDFRLGQERFYTGLPDQGMNVIPGGDAISTPLLENIVDQVNSDKINSRIERTRNRIYGDWLLEAQPFREVGRELSEQDVTTHLESDNWLEFFGDAMEDSEIQSKVTAVERVQPFINHLVYQENAPFILKEARPWAMEEIRSEMNSENFDVEIAPVIDALMNPDKSLTDEKIKKLEAKEETGDIRPENIIPDYPHQGTSYGAEGEFAKDLLHREIYELLTNYPDANVIGLHRWGTEGSPGSPYAAAITEAKKLAAENPSISIEKIAEFPITRREKVDGQYQTVQRMQEIWLVFVGDVRENIILHGGVEGMMKGGLVKKATNQVLNYGDYGRRFI
jgi:hypothetical protein